MKMHCKSGSVWGQRPTGARPCQSIKMLFSGMVIQRGKQALEFSHGARDHYRRSAEVRNRHSTVLEPIDLAHIK